MAKISYQQQQRMGIVQGTPRTFVTPAPAPTTQQAPAALPPSTALAPVAPIAPRALIDSHNRLIDVYAEQAKHAARVGEVLPADHSAPRGYSSAAELSARNQRFYATVGAMVGVAAFAMWGIVSVAHAAGFVGDNWTLPLWIALTGCSAFLTIRSVHGSEQRLAPEAIELNRQENEFAIGMKDAETRQLAIRLAGQIDRERVKLEREQAAAQRESNRRLTLETQARINDQMARHTQPQSSLNRLNTYRAPVAYVAPQSAPNALEAPVDSAPVWYDQENEIDDSSAVYGAMPVEQQVELDAPIIDPVRVAMLNFCADLYLDRDPTTNEYRRMDSDGRLAKGIIAPWSKRGGFNATQRQQAQEILRQVTPWLFRYDETAKAWFANLRDYKRAVDVVRAIDAAYTPAIRGK